MYLPTIFNTTDPFAVRNTSDMLDRMFDLSFPWKLMKTFRAEPADSKLLTPALDVTSDDKTYTVSCEIAGVPAEDVKLEVKNGALVLSGEKKEEKTDGDQHITERRYGSFMRQLALPDDADTAKITASHKHGVLTISIPKKAASETAKKSEITSEA